MKQMRRTWKTWTTADFRTKKKKRKQGGSPDEPDGKTPGRMALTTVIQTMMTAQRERLRRAPKALRLWKRAPEQKERMRREKKMGEKKAKKIWRKGP